MRISLIRFITLSSIDAPFALTGSGVGSGVGATTGATTGATSSTTFDIKKNGSNVGTADWAGAAQVATFTMGSETIFDAGDVLSVHAPSTPDATLADIALALKGTR